MKGESGEGGMEERGKEAGGRREERELSCDTFLYFFTGGAKEATD